jgi:hypothetical protein
MQEYITLRLPTDQLDEMIDELKANLSDEVSENIKNDIIEEIQKDIEKNIDDYIDLDDIADTLHRDYLDYDQIASEIENRNESFSSQIESLIGEFNPGAHCGLGRAVEGLIEDSIVYSMFNNDEFAKKLGSFIDNWLYKPTPEPEVTESIMSGVTERLGFPETKPAEPTISLTVSQLNEIIHRSLTVGLVNTVNNNVSDLVDIAVNQFDGDIQSFINTELPY